MRAAAVIFLLATIGRLTRRLGVQRVLRMVEGLAPTLALLLRPASTSTSPSALAKWVDAADQRFATAPGRCLPRSLLLYGMLRARGHQPEFKVGVRTVTGVFESHAWVELQGQVLNDTPDVATLYAPFALKAGPRT